RLCLPEETRRKSRLHRVEISWDPPYGSGPGAAFSAALPNGSIKRMKIINVVGARPNFIKVAPLMKEMRRYPQVLPVLIHTGQHDDPPASEHDFVEPEIP